MKPLYSLLHALLLGLCLLGGYLLVRPPQGLIEAKDKVFGASGLMVTDLAAMTIPTGDDLLYIVDTGSNTSNKITYANFSAAVTSTVSETDTLASVTARGASTAVSSAFNGGLTASTFTAPTGTISELNFTGSTGTRINSTTVCVSGDCKTAWPTGGGSGTIPDITTVLNAGRTATTTPNFQMGFNATTGTVTTSLTVNSQNVCLADGTNCPTTVESQGLNNVINVNPLATSTPSFFGGAIIGSTLMSTGTTLASSTVTTAINWVSATGTNSTTTNFFFTSGTGTTLNVTNLVSSFSTTTRGFFGSRGAFLGSAATFESTSVNADAFIVLNEASGNGALTGINFKTGNTGQAGTDGFYMYLGEGAAGKTLNMQIQNREAGRLNFASGGSLSQWFLSGGQAGDAPLGSFIPSDTNRYDLGSSASSVRNIYVSGTQSIFQGLTMVNSTTTNATTTNLFVTNATGTVLTLTGNFSAGSSTVTTLNYTFATGTDIFATTIRGSQLFATSGTVNTLSFDNATGSNLDVKVARVNGVSVCLLDGTNCPASYATFAVTGSFTIPNGTAPVVDGIGKIAWDTTDNQFAVGTSTNDNPIVYPSVMKMWGGTVASTSNDFVSGGRIPLPPQRDGFKLTEIHCYVVGGTSVVINLDTVAGGSNTDSLTCATTLTSDTAMSQNFTIAAGALEALEIGTITGTVNYVSFSAWGTYTRE